VEEAWTEGRLDQEMISKVSHNWSLNSFVVLKQRTMLRSAL